MNQVQWYGQWWWLSFRVLFLAFFVTCTISAVIQYIQGTCGLDKPVFFGVITLAGILFNSQYCYYFGVTDNELIIKNHIRRWYRKSYLIQDIKSIRMETSTNKIDSDSIRIFITPASYQLYYAATLTGKRWHLLEQQLEAKGLRVNNFISYGAIWSS
ncbi:MAG: hypothetical protein EOP52_08490 [Sphingobacteriales bacterium]|nr:MAG: hypothetical protein EOP52_08490 [Sphingobacteriales bacterium]